MYKTSLRMFVSGFKKKKAMKRHPIIMTDADYDYIVVKNWFWKECECE